MVIPEGFAQANLIFTGAAVPLGAEMTLGLELILGTPSPEEVAESVAGIWEVSGLLFQVDDITLERVAVKFGPNDTGPSGEFALGTNGGDAGEPDSPNVAVLVKKQTALGGRAGRGRWFIPGIRETRVEPGGHINGDYAEDLQAALENFRAGLITDDLRATLLHGPDSPITEPTEITSFIVDSTAATQRRRLRH